MSLCLLLVVWAATNAIPAEPQSSETTKPWYMANFDVDWNRWRIVYYNETDAPGTIWMIDTKTIERATSGRHEYEIWEQELFSTVQQSTNSKTYDSWTVRKRIRCGSESFKVLRKVFHFEKKLVSDETFHDAEWTIPIPQTVGEDIVDTECDLLRRMARQ